jgi:nitrate/nitrite transport system substrate-binding protein
VLGCTADFAKQNPNTVRAMTAAVLDAGRWIDASLSNRQKMAEVVAAPAYINTSVDVINQRILGRYTNGLGKTWDDPNHMKFYNDGYVNFPYLSDGMWFLTQHRRWGLLKSDPDYLAVAKQINRIDIYKEAATLAKTSIAKDPMRVSKLMDGVVWDGKDPKKYAQSFPLKVA